MSTHRYQIQARDRESYPRVRRSFDYRYSLGVPFNQQANKFCAHNLGVSQIH
jgi:hypothetical protein